MPEPYVWTGETGITEIDSDHILWIADGGNPKFELELPNRPEEKARLAQAIVGDTHLVIRKDQLPVMPPLQLARFESEELANAIADAGVQEADDE